MVEEDGGDREQCGRITWRNEQKYHIMIVSEWHKTENDEYPWQPTCWLQMAHNDDDWFIYIWASKTPAMHFDLQPLSSIDCYQLPGWCLSISFWITLLLVFLLWVFILILSWPTCVAHSVYMSCLCPVLSCTALTIISFTPVLHLIISFWILSLFVMFNNNLSMLRRVSASVFSWCFVRVHVSVP